MSYYKQDRYTLEEKLENKKKSEEPGIEREIETEIVNNAMTKKHPFDYYTAKISPPITVVDIDACGKRVADKLDIFYVGHEKITEGSIDYRRDKILVKMAKTKFDVKPYEHWKANEDMKNRMAQILCIIGVASFLLFVAFFPLILAASSK